MNYNPFLRLARYTGVFLSCGFTGGLIYAKMNKYKECSQMLDVRKDDPLLLLPPHLTNLVNEVMEEMKLKEDEKSHIKFFLSEAPDFQRFCSIIRRGRALLGIPKYFLIDQNIDVKVSNPTKVTESQTLVDTLHLSNDAKKFAVARELYEVLNSNNHILYTIPSITTFYFIFYSQLVEEISKKQMQKTNFFPHIILLLLGISAYAILFDLITHYTEMNADFLASVLGESYKIGGIEYYEKVIERNKALKKLDKSAPYSEDGDISGFLFRKPHMPLLKRLTFLKECCDEKKEISVFSYVIFANMF